MENNNYPKGILYVAIAAFMWSLVSIALKAIENDIPMATVNGFRFLSSFVILSIFLLFRNRNHFAILKQPPLYAIIASIGLGLNYLGYVFGVKYASAGTTQVIIQIGPLLFAVSGFVLFKEVMSRRHTLGIILTLVGLSVFYYFKWKEVNITSERFIEGVVWILVSAVAWTFYAIFQKKAMKVHPAHEINLILYLIPTLAFLPFMDFSLFSDFTLLEWGLMLFLGLNTVIAYGFLSEGLAIIEANKASMIITLNPLLTFVIMYLISIHPVAGFQGESFSAFTIAGALLALTGVIIVVGAKRRFRNQ